MTTRFEQTIDHHIQRQLFHKLVGADSLRYSELKPKNLEANLFMYHLKELIRMDLVIKEDKKYKLSDKGRMLATKFSMRESGIRQMPSTISVIVLRANDGSWLIYERKRQPYIGWFGWPSGKIHFGETLSAAAHRELEEKCGYTDMQLKLRGNFSLITKSKPLEFTNHIIGYVWEAEVAEKLVVDNQAGVTFWVDDWRDLDYSKFISGFREITEKINSKQKNFILDMNFD